MNVTQATPPTSEPDQQTTHTRTRIVQWIKQHRSRLIGSLRILTAVILMGIVLSLVSGDWDEFVDVDWRLVPLAMGLDLLATVAKALRWSLLVRQSQMKISFRHLLGTYLVGAFFSTVLPTSVGGDAVRAVETASKSGRAADATSSVLIERGMGLLVVIGSGSLFALLLEPNRVPLIFQLFVHGLFVSGIVGLIMLRQGWFMDPLATLLTRFKLAKIANMVRKLQDAFAGHLGRPGILVMMLALSIVAHAATIMATYIVLDAVTDTIPLGAFVPVIALTTTAELIPISIASLGVKESAYVYFLGLASVGAPEATIVALIMRGIMLGRALLGGIVFLLRSIRRGPKASQPTRSPDHTQHTTPRTGAEWSLAVSRETDDTEDESVADDAYLRLPTPIP